MLFAMDMPLPFVFFVFVVGIVFGSFGNVLICRLPKGKSIGGHSACPRCGAALSIGELIPVISFVVLRARCRSCKRAISWQYPLVEIASGLLFLFAFFWMSPDLVRSFLLAFCLWLMLLIAVTDAKTATIPDTLNIPFLVLGIAHAYMNDLSFLLPAIIGAGFFAVQWVVSRGRWVGSGDIILAAGLGAFLGSIPLLLLALWFAYMTGAAWAAVLLIRRKKGMESQLAFGPFLILGTVVSLVAGEGVLRWMGW